MNFEIKIEKKIKEKLIEDLISDNEIILYFGDNIFITNKKIIYLGDIRNFYRRVIIPLENLNYVKDEVKIDWKLAIILFFILSPLMPMVESFIESFYKTPSFIESCISIITLVFYLIVLTLASKRVVTFGIKDGKEISIDRNCISERDFVNLLSTTSKML